MQRTGGKSAGLSGIEKDRKSLAPMLSPNQHRSRKAPDLHVVGRLLGQEVTEKMAKQMEYPWKNDKESTSI
jgi:hypothetical protein